LGHGGGPPFFAKQTGGLFSQIPASLFLLAVALLTEYTHDEL
jgi:hypothetical protein